jgi:hypothetical protein
MPMYDTYNICYGIIKFATILETSFDCLKAYRISISTINNSDIRNIGTGIWVSL